jgi:hypothetical protein
MKEVKEKGKECIILTNQTAHVNSALTAVADQLILCEQKATKAVRDKHSRSKLAELLGRLFSKSKESVLPLNSLNDYFVNNGYNFKAHGYVSFKDCLGQCINESNYSVNFDEGTITKI